jgi:hypothetical protein
MTCDLTWGVDLEHLKRNGGRGKSLPETEVGRELEKELTAQREAFQKRIDTRLFVFTATSDGHLFIPLLNSTQ